MSIITLSGNRLTINGRYYIAAHGKNGFSADKEEGDFCTPLGEFYLRECWYRADRVSAPLTNLPLKIITREDGWCDDPESKEYNKPVKLPFSGSISYSHEKLFRDDHVYDIIIPLGYNDNPPIKGKGSAIFLHIAHDDYRGTEGCVALKKEDLLEVIADCDNNSKIIIS